MVRAPSIPLYKYLPRQRLNVWILKKKENNYYLTPTVVINYTKNWIYTDDAPWTTAAISQNNPVKKIEKVHPVPLKDWFWHRGDFVNK